MPLCWIVEPALGGGGGEGDPEGALEVFELDAAGLEGEDFEGLWAAGEAEEIARAAFVEFVGAVDVEYGGGGSVACGEAGQEGDLMAGGGMLDDDETFDPAGEGVGGRGADFPDGPAGAADGVANAKEVLAGGLGELLNGGVMGDHADEVKGKLGGADAVELEPLAGGGWGDEA